MTRRPPHHQRRSNRVVDDTPRTMTIERLIPGGTGLARDEGGVLFVSGTAPGDVVVVDHVEKVAGARRGRLTQVLTASPDRTSVDCVHADRCGGCDWLHLSAEARARHKVSIAIDALRRVGRLDDSALEKITAIVRPPLTDPGRALAGRRRCRVRTDTEGRATFSEQGSHVRATVSSCLALHERLERAVLDLARAGLPADLEVRLATSDAGVVVAAVHNDRAARALVDAGVVVGAISVDVHDDSVDRVVAGNAVVRGEVTAGAYDAVSDAATFTQATRHGGAAIRDAVMDAVNDVVDGAHVTELFCGAGHLTLPLAARAARITAIEGSARATRHLRANATLARANATLARAPIDVVTAFIDGAVVRAHIDTARVLVVDPPRTGLIDARAVFSAAKDGGVQRVVLVSCDPATGARDLREALGAGFVLDALTPIDAFPRTHHLEWVARLSRS